MEGENLTIGTLAARTQCTVPTIRYYEEIGLLPQPARSANGRRYYGEADQKRLLFIKRCRDFGFPIDQVRNLLSLFEDGDRSCTEARDMAQEHLMQVRARLAELRKLEGSLREFVSSCDQACIGGAARECTIIDELASSPLSSRRGDQDDSGRCGGPREGVEANAAGFHEARRR